MSKSREALFHVGQIVLHRRFGYRGVVIDVDAEFSLSDEWYEAVARSRPPRDRPWYHVLVHGNEQQTYVAERHLEADPDPQAIDHPAIGENFSELRDGRYVITTLPGAPDGGRTTLQ